MQQEEVPLFAPSILAFWTIFAVLVHHFKFLFACVRGA
jgi:hypothetical protein